MKTSYLKIFAVAAFVAFSGCKENKAGEAETTYAEDVTVTEASAVTYNAVLDQSTIEWKGSKPLGSHNGTIAISKGSVQVNDGALESGNFTIDMNSITVLDLEAGDGKEDLEAHLKGTIEGKEDHFFYVEKYPTAKFEVTGIETTEGKTMLSGNLTLKAITKNISMPVTTSMSDYGNTMTLKSDTFTIDRTKWNVQYGSKSVFDNLGDKFINDNIELTVHLVASKA